MNSALNGEKPKPSAEEAATPVRGGDDPGSEAAADWDPAAARPTAAARPMPMVAAAVLLFRAGD
jgi:hypothetical protein